MCNTSKEKDFVQNRFSVKFLPSTKSPLLAAVDYPPIVDQFSVTLRRRFSNCHQLNRIKFKFLFISKFVLYH
ncbi:unnamed protein product [Trifolium pratense]|uniref:Uncharacterized protein n=1 Tax=Trifolium pratense TaxID=57577 RepID=A0ACB0JQ84_TRIPR|nr:unnamed protein product [Trifolium pratense]